MNYLVVSRGLPLTLMSHSGAHVNIYGVTIGLPFFFLFPIYGYPKII